MPTAAKVVDVTELWLTTQIDRAAREGVFTVTANLTPDLAVALLTRNPDNRKLSRYKIAEYAADVAADRWDHNGASIVVSKDGYLNDGQHRCEAVIEAGKAIVTQITFGVERDTRSTIDVGLKRTVGSHLGMRGYTNVNHLTVMVSNLIVYERLGRMELTGKTRPSVAKVMDWLVAHPDHQDHLNAAVSLRGKVHVSVGLFGALHYLFEQRDHEATKRFFELLGSGAELAANDPVYKLRELLITNAMRRAKLPPIEIAARAIKAWNLWRRGATVTALQFRRLGENPERFPTPE